MLMKRYSIIVVVLFVLIGMVYMSSCDRTIFTSNPDDILLFSEDTLQFDTIFTSIGSTTQFFTVYNSNNSQTISIDRIYLAGQNQSNFRININGNQSILQENVEIPPGDSIFIFVEVTIDPNQDDMIEQDSIVFVSNGNVQNVDLIAFGQDVFLIDGQIINNDTVWNSQKPVLIFNSALVDTFATLTVEAGAQIFFHKSSSLFVKGSLVVQGALNQPVVFSGDRLEDSYDEIPGQWGAYITDDMNNLIGIYGGIHLLAGSRNNKIDYAIIKNGIIGLQVDSVVTPGIPSLVLSNTSIENMNVSCLYALGSHVVAHNCVFANSGQYTIACVIGGNYSFTHCTMANFWTSNRQTPQLLLNNYYTYSGSGGETNVEYRDLTNAYFGNCIVYGNKDVELLLDLSVDAESSFFFDHCLLTLNSDINTDNPTFFNSIIVNQNPKFIDVNSPYDYHLDTLSSAKDVGSNDIALPFSIDIDGNSRLLDSNPDLGAFERIE